MHVYVELFFDPCNLPEEASSFSGRALRCFVSRALFSVSSHVLLGTPSTCGKSSILWNLSVIRCLGIRMCVSKVMATFDCVRVPPASDPAL